MCFILSDVLWMIMAAMSTATTSFPALQSGGVTVIMVIV